MIDTFNGKVFKYNAKNDSIRNKSLWYYDVNTSNIVILQFLQRIILFEVIFMRTRKNIKL